MDPFELVRRSAAQLHDQLVARGADALNPSDLVEAAFQYLDVNLFWLPAGDPALKGARGVYDDQSGTVCCEMSGTAMLGEPTEAAINAAIQEIVSTPVDDDGLVFDAGTLTVHPIREDNRYGGLRAVIQARLAEARIHVQIDVGFGDAITPGALDLEFPTLLRDMASPHVLAYPTETIIAEKAEAMVDLGISNSRMKDFSDVAMAARRVAFDGESIVVALRATFRRRGTTLPDAEIVALSDRFVQDVSAQANWKAFAARSQQGEFDSLQQVVGELQRFLHEPFAHARSMERFAAQWSPGGPWA